MNAPKNGRRCYNSKDYNNDGNKKPLLHLLNCKIAFEMWNKIKAIFEKDNEQQKCNLLYLSMD